ncbi:hypothetical protein [Duganella sp. BuS-21]|uniref:hypothetical protein n=1 Tax=Duganella sp. BuS-21 TaxID=2943848 RepID=UPI0035A67051
MHPIGPATTRLLIGTCRRSAFFVHRKKKKKKKKKKLEAHLRQLQRIAPAHPHAIQAPWWRNVVVRAR